MEDLVRWQQTAVWIVAVALAVFGVTLLVVAVVRRKKAEREYVRRDTDPLTTLQVQLRLGQIAAEIRALQGSGDQARFASAFHARAAQEAYDSLLCEACRRAGIEDDSPITCEDDRFLRELELASRGWSW